MNQYSFHLRFVDKETEKLSYHKGTLRSAKLLEQAEAIRSAIEESLPLELKNVGFSIMEFRMDLQLTH